MKGGYRAGSGRKKGSKASHTLEAEKAREYIVQKVGASLEPIITSLIKQAKQGDIRAAQTLFERAYGRVAQIEPVMVNVTSQHDEDRRILLTIVQQLRADDGSTRGQISNQSPSQRVGL